MKDGDKEMRILLLIGNVVSQIHYELTHSIRLNFKIPTVFLTTVRSFVSVRSVPRQRSLFISINLRIHLVLQIISYTYNKKLRKKCDIHTDGNSSIC